MLVGFYDLDMLLYKKFYPSLDMMKYSTYHKRKGDIVHMLYDESNWDAYNVVYVRRDKYTAAPPAHIASNPKVAWVGRRFFDGYAIPLDPEVERCSPDQSLYRTWYEANRGKFTLDRRKMINGILLDGVPCRFTFGGELVDGPLVHNQERVYLYDSNGFITREIFKGMEKNPDAVFTFVESQQVYNFDDWKYLKDNFHLQKRNNNIIYVGEMSDEDYKTYYTYFHNQYQMILPLITDDSQVIPQFKRYFNRMFYSISKGTTLYYAFNDNSNPTKFSPLVTFLKPFSKNLGFKSDFCALDYMQKSSKTLYQKLTTDPEWRDIYEELLPYLSQNILEIYQKGEWELYDTIRD
jgi:hypothetical protein